jgi:hypothetical protein
MKDENRMWHPENLEVRSAQPPADLVASVRAKNEARTGFTAEDRAAAEMRLKEIEAELR